MSETKDNTIAIVGSGIEAARHLVRALERQGAVVERVFINETIAGGDGEAEIEVVGSRAVGDAGEATAQAEEPAVASHAPIAAAPTDAEIEAAIEGEVCQACSGRKAWRQTFCNTDFLALNIFQRRQMSMGLRGEAFHDKYRAALAHLLLNPMRKKHVPGRIGEWRYRNEEDLERAGFKFLEHARCAVPGCGLRIVWYRTPNGGKMPVNLEDTQPHKTRCADPEYFQRKREERAQTFARRRADKKARTKKQRRAR